MLDTPILIATPPNSWSPSDSCIPITGLPVWTLSFFSSPLFQSQRAWVGGVENLHFCLLFSEVPALATTLLQSRHARRCWICTALSFTPSTMCSYFLTHHNAFLCLGQGDATEEVPQNFEELKRKQGMKGTPMSLPSLWLAA